MARAKAAAVKAAPKAAKSKTVPKAKQSKARPKDKALANPFESAPDRDQSKMHVFLRPKEEHAKTTQVNSSSGSQCHGQDAVSEIEPVPAQNEDADQGESETQHADLSPPEHQYYDSYIATLLGNGSTDDDKKRKISELISVLRGDQISLGNMVDHFLSLPNQADRNTCVERLVEELNVNEFGIVLEQAKTHARINEYINETIGQEMPDDDWQFGCEKGDPIEDLKSFLEWLVRISAEGQGEKKAKVAVPTPFAPAASQVRVGGCQCAQKMRPIDVLNFHHVKLDGKEIVFYIFIYIISTIT